LKARSILAMVAIAACSAAYADYDPKLEAQEKATRDAEARASAARKADADRQRIAAEQKAMRATLGKEAEGKSDAEVKALYGRKMDGYMDQAKKAQAGTSNAAPGSDQAKAEAQMKGMTGKSMADIQKMSPAEQEAFAKQMEKQYGGAK
jgi:hypothetical protein